MVNLEGKIALITGASRGIGAALAKGFAAKGAHVVALARTQGALEELDDAIRAAGGTATLIPQDLTKLDEVDRLGPALFEKFGKLDIFVGNAGVLGPLTPVHQVKQQDWDRVMLLNFTANARLVRTLDPLLRAAPAGRVIFTMSSFDETLAYWGPYAVSTGALRVFAETYAAETRRTNMRVSMVEPGAVDTAMTLEAFPGGYPGKLRKPEDVVSEYLKLAA